LHQNYLKEPDELRTKLEWAYGIRCADTKRPIQYVVGRPEALSTGGREKFEKTSVLNSEEIAYFTASIVVLYNTRLNTQRFYVQHEAELLSLAVSNQSGDLIATGEMADHPCIHVWNSRTLDNYAILKGLHKRGVHMIAFSNNDEYLITCGMTRPSAVIIYDWKT
jgi:WD40 repeat protein